MAPEVIKPSESGVGRLGASDVWAMGCVILEISTGCVLAYRLCFDRSLTALCRRKPWNNLDNEWSVPLKRLTGTGSVFCTNARTRAIMFHIGVATQHPPLPESGELSELGISFIEQCLTIDPWERPTASELLESPWLESLIEQLQVSYLPSTGRMISYADLFLSSQQEQDNKEIVNSPGGPTAAATTEAPAPTDAYAKQLAQHVLGMADENATPGSDSISLSLTPIGTTPPPIEETAEEAQFD